MAGSPPTCRLLYGGYAVTAYMVMACIDVAYIVMALYSYGLQALVRRLGARGSVVLDPVQRVPALRCVASRRVASRCVRACTVPDKVVDLCDLVLPRRGVDLGCQAERVATYEQHSIILIPIPYHSIILIPISIAPSFECLLI